MIKKYTCYYTDGLAPSKSINHRVSAQIKFHIKYSVTTSEVVNAVSVVSQYTHSETSDCLNAFIYSLFRVCRVRQDQMGEVTINEISLRIQIFGVSDYEF